MTGSALPQQSTGELLAEHMCKGEEPAFCEFAARYAPRFRAYFLRHGLPMTQAEDLAYTAVTEISLRMDRFANQGAGSFERWAFTLVQHLYVGWLRQRAKEAEEIEAAASVARGRGRPTGRSVSPLTERVRTALARLSESEQEVLLLRTLAIPFTFAEIGRELGISESAARVRHHRALARLRQLLPADAESASMKED